MECDGACCNRCDRNDISVLASVCEYMAAWCLWFVGVTLTGVGNLCTKTGTTKQSVWVHYVVVCTCSHEVDGGSLVCAMSLCVFTRTK